MEYISTRSSSVTQVWSMDDLLRPVFVSRSDVLTQDFSSFRNAECLIGFPYDNKIRDIEFHTFMADRFVQLLDNSFSSTEDFLHQCHISGLADSELQFLFERMLYDPWLLDCPNPDATYDVLIEYVTVGVIVAKLGLMDRLGFKEHLRKSVDTMYRQIDQLAKNAQPIPISYRIEFENNPAEVVRSDGKTKGKTILLRKVQFEVLMRNLKAIAQFMPLKTARLLINTHICVWIRLLSDPENELEILQLAFDIVGPKLLFYSSKQPAEYRSLPMPDEESIDINISEMCTIVDEAYKNYCREALQISDQVIMDRREMDIPLPKITTVPVWIIGIESRPETCIKVHTEILNRWGYFRNLVASTVIGDCRLLLPADFPVPCFKLLLGALYGLDVSSYGDSTALITQLEHDDMRYFLDHAKQFRFFTTCLSADDVPLSFLNSEALETAFRQIGQKVACYLSADLELKVLSKHFSAKRFYEGFAHSLENYAKFGQAIALTSAVINDTLPPAEVPGDFRDFFAARNMNI